MNGKEASDIIEAAINQALVSNEDHDENDMLVDWVVLSFVANPDTEKGGAYPMFVSNGNMPTYRVIGLLHAGLLAYEQFSELNEGED